MMDEDEKVALRFLATVPEFRSYDMVRVWVKKQIPKETYMTHANVSFALWNLVVERRREASRARMNRPWTTVFHLQK